MPIIPTAQLQIDRETRQVTLLRFGYAPDVHLSVPTGDFVVQSWQNFEASGFDKVAEAIANYHMAYSDELSQFESLSSSERKTFFLRHVGIGISERGSNLWWIGLMETVPDGSGCVYVGPEYNITFEPSSGRAFFVDAVAKLFRSGCKRSTGERK